MEGNETDYRRAMLLAIFNHLALPLRLPGKSDNEPQRIATALVQQAIQSVKDINKLCPSPHWDGIRRSLLKSSRVLGINRLDAKTLLTELRELLSDEFMVIHVNEQNASVLIFMDDKHERVIFEIWEASATGQAVLASEDFLEWSFPGSSVSLPIEDFHNDGFLKELAQFLDQAHKENVKLYGATAFKAHITITESRDTARPYLVSRLLATLLGSSGTYVDPPILTKHVRDDACWTDGAEYPWRRSPIWLSLRVALQRWLYALLGDQIGRVHYKFLIALLLSHFLDEVSGSLAQELVHYLKAKICGRMSKLERERISVAPNIKAEYDRLFATVSPTISSTLQKVTSSIVAATNAWRRQQAQSLTLPKFPPRNALVLRLENSRDYLRSVLDTPYGVHGAQTANRYGATHSYQAKDGVGIGFEIFARECSREVEIRFQFINDNSVESCRTIEYRCTSRASNITRYLLDSPKVFQGGPVEISLFILSIMEAWMRLDQDTLELYPLLKEYTTGFQLAMFEDLQLFLKSDMERLHQVEQYLRQRNTNASKQSPRLIDKISSDCFAYRYAKETPSGQDIQALRHKIEATTKQKIEAKTKELELAMERYVGLVQQQIVATCICGIEDGERVRDSACHKCRVVDALDRQRIERLEVALPEDEVQALSICFELQCPSAFARYRDVTWMILQRFGFRQAYSKIEARVELGKHPDLRGYRDRDPMISLASSKKSFGKTHYSKIKLPATISEVIVPFAPLFEYYDTQSRIWPARGVFDESLAVLIKPNISDTGSLASVVLRSFADATTGKLTSNHIVSTQPQCPRDVSLSEFMAVQSIISRNFPHCLWPQILVELGQSAINFSSQSASAMISTVIQRAGPASPTAMRISHAILATLDFGSRLLSRLQERLDSISQSTSEVNILEMIIDMAIKLWSLTSSEAVKEDASHLIKRVRSISYRWIQVNSTHLQRSHDLSLIQRLTRYTLRTALLTRKTFMICDNWDDLGPDAAEQLVQAAIAIRRNTDKEIEQLPVYFKHAFRWDFQWIHLVQNALAALILAHPDALLRAVQSIHSGFSANYSIGKLSFEKPWISGHLSGPHGLSLLEYNLTEGLLLINGYPDGQLPQKYQNDPVLIELFENRALSAWRTNDYGMEWKLTLRPQGQDVYLGSRPGAGLIVKTVGNKGVFELIPRTKFSNSLSFDLPGHLIEGHFHWLQLETRQLHIRKASSVWATKSSSWILHLDTNQAVRGDCILIDPASRTARQVLNILTRIETSDQILPYCGKMGRLSAELPRMELRFVVNRNNRLHSYQLQAEIDEDQDAGTLYGLTSKLVLRNSFNSHQRSIIVPFETLRYRMNGDWPDVHVLPDRSGFARFDIDPILGRLTCASEPRLLYYKVYLHALTASAIPDTLTGRTGTEEAIYWLSSGCAIPWQPLGKAPMIVLYEIRKLSPSSEYYPSNLKRLKKAHWSSVLSTQAQDPRYRILVDGLLERSNDIATFTENIVPAQGKEEPLRQQEDHHLHRRLLVRHQLYRRHALNEEQLVVNTEGQTWNTRDKLDTSNTLCRKVAKIVAAVSEWPTSMNTTPNLLETVEKAAKLVDNIAGYEKQFDAILLSDRVDGYIVARDFGPLLQTCRRLGRQNKAQLTFLLGTLAFNDKVDIHALLVALAFALWPELHAISPPGWQCYTAFSRMHVPPTMNLVDLIRPHGAPHKAETHLLMDYIHRKQRLAIESARRKHEQSVEKQCVGFAELLAKQWPSLELSVDDTVATSFPLLGIEAAIVNVKPAWERFVSYMQLTQYLETVQTILSHRAVRVAHLVSYEKPLVSRPTVGNYYSRPKRAAPLTIQDLVRLPCSASWLVSAPKHTLTNPIGEIETHRTDHKVKELDQILAALGTTPSKTQSDFAKKMQASLQAFRKKLSYQSDSQVLTIPENLDYQVQCAEADANACLMQIIGAMQAQESSWFWLHLGGLLPMLNKVDMLQTLRLLGAASLDFGSGTHSSIVRLAVLLVRLQRLCRIQDAYRKGNATRLQDELDQLDSTHFDLQQNSNWLLFELDSNITLRRAQIDIANATVSPDSGANSLHQLMMGQGKTSCILPISALALANGESLVRVVVPRALVLQTAQLLQHRLGALNGRVVMHIPFSRKTSTSTDQIRLLRRLYEEMLRYGGVVVTTPEHSLSLMLSGIQRTIDQRLEEAQELVSMHRWLQGVSRNILDESDLILDCKTQLIYPSGTLAPVDGHPNRWLEAEKLFKLVKSQLWSVQQKYPNGIQIFESMRGFPFVYFLRKEAEDELIQRLADDLTAETSNVLPMQGCRDEHRALVRSFITLPGITPEIKKGLSETWNADTLKTIYLLRGLLVHRILLHTLKKRWNVQYGISEDRTPIAVPFVAKGSPSENAEYGHCDVSILLTILAFYYGGVTKQQLQQVLDFVLRFDNAGSQYERIADSVYLPERWRSLQAINTKDDSHMEELHRYLQYSTIVCDLYLNHLVFPQHARQFDVKIAASGWDITGAQLSADSSKTNLTTGFSGTIDSACLLPLTIAQQELDDFRHTNAEALVYLLEERNSHYEVLRRDGLRLSEEQLLYGLERIGIRCLIDSGSFILALSNEEVAKLWLMIDARAPAAIYFQSDNRAMVQYRSGLKMPLVASPFADNTRDALVYFSNAHCRGSDLKLPEDARGALTLGMYHTKDALVQSAMRLRLLPTTQSVTFFAPPEVHQAILDCVGKSESDRLASRDVIAWILRETCRSLEELQPLWHAQGSEHLDRTQALLAYPDLCTDSVHRESALRILCQKEKLQLEDLYGTRSKAGRIPLSGKLVAIRNELKQRASQFHDAGHAVHASALQEVEQEREVEQEVVHEQQVQRPRYHHPHRFAGLHSDIENFVQTGWISERSSVIEHYGSLLARTLIGKRYGVSQTVSRLYVTTAYGTTVNAIPPNDNFVRPANWILWSSFQQLAILIAPEEADCLIPLLRNVYLLSYSAPTTRSTIHFNDLTYCAIPPLPSDFRFPLWLKTELGIFAGKLFFEFEEYVMIRALLYGTAQSATRGQTPFGNKPLAFLQDWLALRRVDQDLLDTPMGYIVQGRELAENHHFFRKDTTRVTHLHTDVHDEEKKVDQDVADDSFFEDQIEHELDDLSDNDNDEQQEEAEEEV